MQNRLIPLPLSGSPVRSGSNGSDGSAASERVDLSQQMLAVIPAAIASVAVLRHINLDSNRLTNFPVELASLPSLHWLSLRWNAIEALPDAIGACGSLRHLDCSFNQISSVSGRIGACKSLATLLLHDNSLTALPDSLGELGSALKELNVDFNQLSRLPNSIAHLFAPRGCLQALHVRGNPLVLPPPETVLDGFAALAAYYVRLPILLHTFEWIPSHFDCC
jgi:Leucine-rich repeat (LRR) protein